MAAQDKEKTARSKKGSEARVLELVREYLMSGLEGDEAEAMKGIPITRLTRLMEDLDFDPLDVIECVMLIEDDFDGLFLTETQCNGLKTVGDLMDAVNEATDKGQRYS